MKSMSNKKKVNPKKKVITQADLNRIKHVIADEMTESLYAMVFTILRDKRGFSHEELHETWDDLCYLADSINQDYVNIADLKNVLKQEEGLVFKIGHKTNR